jgi:hypothetical protein
LLTFLLHSSIIKKISIHITAYKHADSRYYMQ